MQIIFQPKQDWVPVWLLHLSNCLSSLWNAVDCEACLVSSTNCTTLRNRYDWTPDTPVQSGKIPNVPGFKSGSPGAKKTYSKTVTTQLHACQIVAGRTDPFGLSNFVPAPRHPPLSRAGHLQALTIVVISRPSLKALATELHNLHTIE